MIKMNGKLMDPDYLFVTDYIIGLDNKQLMRQTD